MSCNCSGNCSGPKEPAGNKLLSNCAKDPVTDLVDCNCIPYDRDCNGAVKMPFRTVVKPGDPEDGGNPSYPHRKDPDTCDLVICGCPKTQHDMHYPTKKGDPCIGVAGGGVKYDPETGVWNLPKPIKFGPTPNDCNGIKITEEDDCVLIEVIKSEFIQKSSENPVENGISKTIVAGDPDNPTEIARVRFCFKNDACSTWFAIPYLSGDIRGEGGADNIAYGVWQMSTDEGATWGFSTDREFTVGQNGRFAESHEAQGLGFPVQPGEEKCIVARLAGFTSDGTATVTSYSMIAKVAGYTVTG